MPVQLTADQVGQMQRQTAQPSVHKSYQPHHAVTKSGGEPVVQKADNRQRIQQPQRPQPPPRQPDEGTPDGFPDTATYRRWVSAIMKERKRMIVNMRLAGNRTLSQGQSDRLLQFGIGASRRFGIDPRLLANEEISPIVDDINTDPDTSPLFNPPTRPSAPTAGGFNRGRGGRRGRSGGGNAGGGQGDSGQGGAT